MPAHTSAWNNLSPVGSDLASSIDDFMRAMKVDVDERMNLQHYWADAIAVGNDQDGTHKEITITPATTNTPLLKTNANQSLTGSNASSAIDLGITWNTTGAPTGIKANITDTASDAASLLLDLQVGGASRWKVSKSGLATLTGTTPRLDFAGSTSNMILMPAAGLALPAFTTRSAGTKFVLYNALSGSLADYAFGVDSNLLWSTVPNSSAGYGWYAGTTSIMALAGNGDLTLTGTITTPITPNNVFYRSKNSGGTVVSMIGIDASSNIYVGHNSSAQIGSTNFRSGQLFTWNINGTTFWNMNNSGILYPETTNAYDIGDASHRVRTGFFGTLNVLNGPVITGSTGSLDLQAPAGQGSAISLRSGAGGGCPNISLVAHSGVASAIGSTLSIGRNSNASPSSGCIAFENISGTVYYLWVDSAGKLRIGTTLPAGATNDATGGLVGLQS